MINRLGKSSSIIASSSVHIFLVKMLALMALMLLTSTVTPLLVGDWPLLRNPLFTTVLKLMDKQSWLGGKCFVALILIHCLTRININRKACKELILERGGHEVSHSPAQSSVID